MRLLVLVLLAVLGVFAYPTNPTVHACGGMFCDGVQPVDQQAENVIFAVRSDGRTDMIVQIRYQGDADAFAWVLPLAQVPEGGSFELFDEDAFTRLAQRTRPDVACRGGRPPASEEFDSGSMAPVDVLLEETVGPFDAVVVGSDDPQALVDWLRREDFRVTSAMEPFIADYTREGLRFLALKLRPQADVSEIAPLKFTLPGGAPTIPIRLTAVAAEPEMGLRVFIFADERYTPANWPEVVVDDEDVVTGGPAGTNWAAAAAKAIDGAGGRGFVVERAIPTEGLAQTDDPDALRALFEAHPFVTRLYARLSPEEMTSDPVFRRSGGVDIVESPVACPDAFSSDPCDFVTCGASGACGRVTIAGALTPGCACPAGLTARTTLGPFGNPTVICQDARMSFLNPGDRETPGSAPLPDPCVGFDCGAGTCFPVNMTPTCVCDEGSLAIGWLADDGARQTRCVGPDEPLPRDFYDAPVPELPTGGGVPLDVVPMPAASPGGRGCGVAEAKPPPAGLAGFLVAVAWLGARRRRRPPSNDPVTGG